MYYLFSVQSLDKTENGKFKVILRSHHIAAVLEHCKVCSSEQKAIRNTAQLVQIPTQPICILYLSFSKSNNALIRFSPACYLILFLSFLFCNNFYLGILSYLVSVLNLNYSTELVIHVTFEILIHILLSIFNL